MRWHFVYEGVCHKAGVETLFHIQLEGARWGTTRGLQQKLQTVTSSEGVTRGLSSQNTPVLPSVSRNDSERCCCSKNNPANILSHDITYWQRRHLTIVFYQHFRNVANVLCKSVAQTLPMKLNTSAISAKLGLSVICAQLPVHVDSLWPLVGRGPDSGFFTFSDSILHNIMTNVLFVHQVCIQLFFSGNWSK